MKKFAYVLKLEQKKWYIGTANDVDFRFIQHAEGKGASWTKQFAPIAVCAVKKSPTAFDEDAITLLFMARYGVDNVRGGSYSYSELWDNTFEAIVKAMCTAFHRCFICYQAGHHNNNCSSDPDSYRVEQSLDQWNETGFLTETQFLAAAKSQGLEFRTHEQKTSTCICDGRKCTCDFDSHGRCIRQCDVCKELLIKLLENNNACKQLQSRKAVNSGVKQVEMPPFWNSHNQPSFSSSSSSSSSLQSSSSSSSSSMDFSG